MSNSSLPNNSSQATDSDQLVIVGIGASAGGLAALRTFFARVPEDSGLAYVVVVHLSPDHESLLADLLQPHLKMPVQQVTESVPLEANQVYVIPPGYNLDTIDTHLRLSELEEERRDRAPIDHFFRTLAYIHDGHSVGIILTGTGSDGTLGIKEIKGQGGLTVVQDPNEAEYDGMPQSAIATGLIDLVLPLAEIPSHIIRFAHTEPRVAVGEEDTESPDGDWAVLQKILAQVRTHTSRDFSRYKRSTILRRLKRRMQLAQLEELDEYLALLRENPEEVVALSDDFLITVTNFFRDPEVFEQLQQAVIPHLFADKDPSETVRVWSAGCSTGEEAYSLAMLLLEEAGRREAPPELQVFASDLHTPSLLRAREGFYPGDIKAELSAERLRRFFVKEEGGYRIRKEVRDLVVFAPHNLLGDPPFSKIDLISCRNLLIYLQREVQSDIIGLFHYALRPTGYLMLGTSETIEGSDLFRTEHKQYCLFRKRNVPAPEPRLPVFPVTQAWRSGFTTTAATAREGEPTSYGGLHQRIVEHYAPPSLLVSPDYKVVHLSEHVGRYLEHPGGEATTNVFKLIRPDFHIDLRAALHVAQEKGDVVHTKPVPVRLEGTPRWVILSVYPADEPQQEGYFMVTFDDRVTPVREVPARTERAARPEGDAATTADGETPKETTVRELETELSLTQQRLQRVIEEYETGQEEMKASNEEMQSTNEELRSTMEELETSKEELQSMNEELSTLNQENRHKVEELSQLSGDLQNLLAATDIATLFLDRQLRIMRFTPQASELFNVRLLDRGRPLSDLTHRLGYDDLQEDAQRVLSKLVPIEREVQDDGGHWYLTRVLPYRSTDDRIEGVVITFIDITSRLRSEESLRRSEERLRLILQSAIDYAIFTMDPDRKVIDWNAGAERIFGYTEGEIVGRVADRLFVSEDRATQPEQEMHIAREEGHAENERWHVRKDGSRFWGSGYTVPLRQENGQLRGFLKIMLDNTDRMQMEEALRQAKDEAERAAHAKEEFLAHMSHEIRTPLNAVVGLSDLLLQQDPAAAQLENLQTLKFSAQNLKMLVNDILDFSKIQAGKVMIEETNTNLKQLLDSLQKAHQTQVAAQGNELNVRIDEQIPDVVYTDSLKLSQVLNNLLSNAVKFTDQGVITVDVSLQQRSDDQLRITFSIQDTGIGIEADKLATIFDTFTQADVTTVRKYGGTGLGLSITKLLLELMGSRIEVESDMNQGTRFYFTLPVRERASDESPADQPLLSPDDWAHFENLQILLVEDAAINRTILIQFMQGWWNIHPDEAQNGQQAVEMVQRKRYDLILMDVRMPVMDGYQATQAIRALPDAHYRQVPILALTADTLPEIAKHSESTLFTDIITKPFNPADLQQKITRYAIAEEVLEKTSVTPPAEGSTGKAASNDPSGARPDLEKLAELFRGNQKKMQRFLVTGVNEFACLQAVFAQAMADGDEAALGNQVHKMIVLLDTLNLSEVQTFLTRARELLTEETTDETREAARQEGEALLEQVVVALRREVEKV